MGFFTGRVTCTRFRVLGHSPGMFTEAHLERLQERAAGTQRVISADGVEVGWSGGDHILDTRFQLEKNVLNDSLHFALRVDQTRLPADLMRAYAQVELEALAANNPSGRPSARQKRDAREAARERLEDEAKDGRFLKRKAYPILWDGSSNELLVATGNASVIDRLHTLFHDTFGQQFEPLTAGRQAFLLAESREQTRGVDDAVPSLFLPGISASQIAWVPDENSRDFLGNEFLLWLWYQLDSEADTLTLNDGSRVAMMLTKSLTLECPKAQTGKETINSDAPTQLPEARRAIQSGKLPRKMGMILVRHDQQYELTFQAETLTIGSARLPAPESVEERARLEERLTQLRHLLETLDLVYDTFCRLRATDAWTKELARIQKWLLREEKARSAG